MKIFITLICVIGGLLEASSAPELVSLFPSQSDIATKYLKTLTPDEMDSNWNLNEFFGSVVVINLARSPERLQSIKEQCASIGCKQIGVFSAIDGRKDVPEAIWKKFQMNWAKIDLSSEKGQETFDNQRKGEAGCYLSHYYIIKNIKQNFDKALADYQKASAEENDHLKKIALQDLLKFRSVMILEDDNGFGIRTPDRTSASLKGTGRVFYEAMSELPTDWDMFYFMTYSRHIRPNEMYKPHLIKVNGGFCANAYVVNHSLYEPILKALSAIEDPSTTFVFPVDSLYANIHPKSRSYAVIPSIAYQKTGSSTINSTQINEVIQFQPFPPL